MKVELNDIQKIISHDQAGANIHYLRVSFHVGVYGPFYADIEERQYNLITRIKAIEPIKQRVEELCGYT